jgi:hypothetical protein
MPSSTEGLLHFSISNGSGLNWEQGLTLTPAEYKTIMTNAYADYQSTHLASGDPRPFTDAVAWTYVCRDLKPYLLTP